MKFGFRKLGNNILTYIIGVGLVLVIIAIWFL